MDLKLYSQKAYKNAQEKGFNRDIELLRTMMNDFESKDYKLLKNNMISTRLMLAVSELGEAMEALRENNHSTSVDLDFCAVMPEHFEEIIKDTFEDEITDAFIVLFGLCKICNIDIQRYIDQKMKYNEGREILHGKEF